MALPTSKDNKAIPLAEFVADLERRRLETGVTDMPRNAGNRRTASKQALLDAIARLGARW